MSATALIAEDEPLLRAELREALATLWPDLEICAETGDGAATLLALEQHKPAILFLDIQMPGLTGLEIAEQASGRSHVVFVTAFNEHATAAFEQGALDYIVKPFSIARLAKTVARLKERVRNTPADLKGLTDALRGDVPAETRYVRWLTVPRGRELRVVTTDEICYLRAANKYTSLFTASAEYLLTSTLKAMREKLDPRSFWQIHRSFVVNVAVIQTIHRSFHGSFEVQLKHRRELLPVSEAYAHLFRQL
ncbi:MAG TPA: LytTR family DNA-binding domain-containing protein [Gammaproteobacteria bacterium]|jgi:DNA-binding LytR/AlgR family response regulator|nr:LytTR family DNA-binding domain-containing protein [Gammaproteobacteria bacterium]